MKNIIIFGKNGQVASDLLEIFALKDQFTIYNYATKDIDFSKLDDLKAFLKKLPKSDIIINATAYNEVDKAEDEPLIADKINHQAVALIAKYCCKHNIKFIHYSTNYVFDGLGNKPYLESNIKNLKPLSIYGKTKLGGEKAIIKSGCEYLIFRLATVFNLNRENNFVSKIKSLAKTNKELKIVDDQITNPTNSYDIARSTIDIIEQIAKRNKFKSAIYNLANNKAISYYQFASNIPRSDNNIKITPVDSNHFSTKAKRPLNGALNCNKVKKDFGIAIEPNYKNITIIIVSYKSTHIIGKALDNIINKGYRIIVVDNGSNDNIEQFLKQKYKGSGIELILLEHNCGFSKANNVALNEVKTKYAFLLNPDAIINEGSIDQLMIESEKESSIALAGAIDIKKENPNKKDQEEAIKDYKSKIKVISENKQYLTTDFICGGYMLMKIDIFKKIGFLDENFFLYGEDEEICDRAIANNLKVIQVKHSYVWHQDHSATKTKNIVDKYSLLYRRYYYMGWGRTYLKIKRQKLSISKIYSHIIKQFLTSFLYLFILDFNRFIARLGRSSGSIMNIIGKDCFNDKNRFAVLKKHVML